MPGVGINLDHLLPESLFVNDTAVAQQQGQTAEAIAALQSQAALSAATQEGETMITIAAIIGAVLFLLIILWYLKS